MSAQPCEPLEWCFESHHGFWGSNNGSREEDSKEEGPRAREGFGQEKGFYKEEAGQHQEGLGEEGRSETR